MSWASVQQCEACWFSQQTITTDEGPAYRWPSRIKTEMTKLTLCVDCGLPTVSGIFVRRQVEEDDMARGSKDFEDKNELTKQFTEAFNEATGRPVEPEAPERVLPLVQGPVEEVDVADDIEDAVVVEEVDEQPTSLVQRMRNWANWAQDYDGTVTGPELDESLDTIASLLNEAANQLVAEGHHG